MDLSLERGDTGRLMHELGLEGRVRLFLFAELLLCRQRLHLCDDVTYVYDHVTYVYDDVTYVYDDVTYVCLFLFA
jgi:hypothetical protein